LTVYGKPCDPGPGVVTTQHQPQRAITALLLIGTVTGIALAASGLVHAGSVATPTLRENAVARVNQRLLLRDEVERIARNFAHQRNVPLTDDLRRSVVNAMVDEELLVQRGLELGLPRFDRRLRSSITRVAIDTIMREQDHPEPTDAALHAFLREHPEIFAPAVKMRLRQVFVRVDARRDADAAVARAREAVQRLRAGADIAQVRTELGDTELAPVPDALLSRAKLLDYIGPTVLQAAAALPSGATSDPIRSTGGYHVVQVVERESRPVPDLAQVREQVLKEYRRRAGDAWLRQRLDRLRDEAHVVVDEP
jgi:parvulin-like peptidyl-prolyl isomerase